MFVQQDPEPRRVLVGTRREILDYLVEAGPAPGAHLIGMGLRRACEPAYEHVIILVLY
jgi:hypothetical protein